jgi:hypothetical protein
MAGTVRRRMSGAWTVRLVLADEDGRQASSTEVECATELEAQGCALTELERRRAGEPHRLGGGASWCYEARLIDPWGRRVRNAYLYSPDEPVEWDDESP